MRNPNPSNPEEILKTIADYKYALDQADIVVITDANGIINYANDNFCKISGYTREELLGHDHSVVNSGYHSKDFFKNLWATIKAGKVWKGEIRNRNKSGTFYWVDTTIVPFLDAGGTPYQYLAIRHDISAQKGVEAQLLSLNHNLEQRIIERTQEVELKRRHFEALIEHSRDGLSLVDAWGTIMYVSPSNKRILGYEAGEMVGKSVAEFIHPEDLQHMFTTLANIVGKGGNSEYIQLRMKHKNGEWRWLEGDGTNMLEFESVKAVVNNYRDITERKKAEAEIKTLNELLEQKVKERTQQLEEVNQEMESFSYTVAHDLRAPLRTINGFAALLASEHGAVLNSEAQSYIEIIRQSSKRMGHLINDLLEFSRLGKIAVAPTACNMAEVVNEALNMCLEAYKENTPEVRLMNLPNAKCDIKLIKHVWVNLISNALKYSSRVEKPVIEIGGIVEDDKVIYYIKDNGIGFDMAYATRLFQMFQRLHSQTEYEGTGVGLALSHRIITKHTGNIWANAGLNQGATFYFSLPL